MFHKKIKSLVLALSLTFTIMPFVSHADSSEQSKTISPESNMTINKDNQFSDSNAVAMAQNPKDTDEPTDKAKYLWPADAPQMDYSVLLQNLKEDKVDTIMLSNDREQAMIVHAYMKDGSKAEVLLVSRLSDAFLDLLNRSNAHIKVVKDFSDYMNISVKISSDEPSLWSTILSWFLTVLNFIIMIAAFAFILIFIQRFAMRSMSKSGKKVKAKDIKVSFADIAGVDDAKRDVREVVEFLNNKKSFDKFGANIPKGIILAGDPGNGKTMLAKAVAKEADADFYQISGSEFVEMYVGLGASRVRSLFKKARKSKKSVIFIDEIDAVGGKRGANNSHGERDQTLNQLLIEMDGFNVSKHDLVIIAATNRIETLDDALLRPGRFDRQVFVAKPNQKGREDILNVYLKKALDNQEKEGHVIDQNGVDVKTLARLTNGFSGAELANLVNESLIRAGKENANHLTQKHLLDARDKMLLGDPRHDLEMLEVEKKTTAYHETGHVVAALLLSHDPVEKVTITPRKMALGLMLQVPEREVISLNEQEIKNKIKILMAGRAAEEVFMEKITTGASNDMERAFELAMRMSTSWGLGNVLRTSAVSDLRSLSDITRSKIETEAAELVYKLYDEVKLLVTNNSIFVQTMTDELLENETLNKREIVELWHKYANSYPVWFNKEDN